MRRVTRIWAKGPAASRCFSTSTSGFASWTLFEDYQQILSLASPPIEALGEPEIAIQLAKAANDGMAELVGKYPGRFPGFVASLPMNAPGALLEEARRAVDELGACGVSDIHERQRKARRTVGSSFALSFTLARVMKNMYHAIVKSEVRKKRSFSDFFLILGGFVCERFRIDSRWT